MSEILEHLHRDHRNMVHLLDLLDEHTGSIADGTEDDFQLLAEIVKYFNHYPTSSHHPYEDKVFNWVCSERPALSEAVEDLRREHASQAGLGEEVAAFLQGVLSGHMVPRQKIVDDLNRYSAVQRAHVDKEEGYLLKETEKLLREKNLDEIPVANRDAIDPVFGAEIDSEFSNLFDALKT
ncbi:MAG: hemerythrin domain-containing protein [Gammaproteobacteria bacterium]|jgi:hemerythrin-like domain-containing protein